VGMGEKWWGWDWEGHKLMGCGVMVTKRCPHTAISTLNTVL